MKNIFKLINEATNGKEIENIHETVTLSKLLLKYNKL